MFLTKKSIYKIAIPAICVFGFGILCMAFGGDLSVLGSAICWLGTLLALSMGYTESKGKIILRGNKLVRQELRPAAFIQYYESVRSAPDPVVNKPSMDVLQVVLLAYDLLGDSENALAVADEMMRTAPPKKKALAMLLKSALLFSEGKVEEAEALFSEAQNQKLDLVCTAMADAILKCDRAIALGDYKTAEVWCRNSLTRTFPKPDKVAKLVTHFALGKIYEQLQNIPQAISYYQYCALYGGETTIKATAESALKRLQ